ncbi:hypothetical protein ACFQV8_31690 [Pseudonocardia benzenivorans]
MRARAGPVDRGQGVGVIRRRDNDIAGVAARRNRRDPDGGGRHPAAPPGAGAGVEVGSAAPVGGTNAASAVGATNPAPAVGGTNPAAPVGGTNPAAASTAQISESTVRPGGGGAGCAAAARLCRLASRRACRAAARCVGEQ